jgi:hypothetical protein
MQYDNELTIKCDKYNRNYSKSSKIKEKWYKSNKNPRNA